MLKPGDKLGAYEIVAQLKRGGMATLYLAQRTGAAGFAKQAAVKVVHPHLADDPSFVQMFLDEARLSARIDHPNVVHVYELGEGEDGMYYLVMEYVHGCSLSQLLRALARAGRKLTPELATWIAMRVAAGLHAAHELPGPGGQRLGVVHRDVSPQNILLAYRGYVKLIDFGIAKARGRSHQTSTGLVKGKFRYMAPEQAANQPVDARTDLYALGIVLWEMLTMRRLFQADDELLLLEQIRKPQVQPPSSVSSDVPKALDEVVMRALAPDPDARFASTHAFQQALARAVPGAPALDAPDLADLLAAVLPEADTEVVRDGPYPSPGRLSPDSSGGRPRPAEEALRTMTIDLSDAGLEALGAETPTSGDASVPPPTDLPQSARPTVRLPSSVHDADAPSEEARPTVRLAGPGASVEAPTTVRAARRSVPDAEAGGADARASSEATDVVADAPAPRRASAQPPTGKRALGLAGGLLALALLVVTVWAMASAGRDDAADEAGVTDAGVVEALEAAPEVEPAAAPAPTDEVPPEGVDHAQVDDLPPPLDEAAEEPPAPPEVPAASPPAPKREARAEEPRPRKPAPRKRPRKPRKDEGTIDGVPMVDDIDL